MGAVNGTNIGFMATPVELEIIDKVQKANYTKGKSEVIRMLIRAGGEQMLKKSDTKKK